jgi:hypothetical protein
MVANFSTGNPHELRVSGGRETLPPSEFPWRLPPDEFHRDIGLISTRSEFGKIFFLTFNG